MNKKIIIPIFIILLLAAGIYQGFFRKEKSAFALATVTRGDIFQEVSETGQVIKGEEINLSFKNAGRIEKIFVEVGKEVKEDESLVKEDASQLKIQFQETQANLSVSQAELNKLLAGASPEEIKIAETTLSNAQTSLENARQNLKDIKAQEEEDLKAAYGDALNTLDDAYLKAYNALNVVDSVQRTYFTGSDQEGLRIKENKNKIETAVSSIKLYLDAAKTNLKNEDTDLALSETKKALENIFDCLKIIREVCEEPSYRDKVSSTNKTSLDTQRTNVNTALTNVVNSQQTISSTKLDNEANINTAQAEVLTTEGKLKAAQDELARILAPPRQEDIDLHQAQVKQAQVQINLLENQIEDAILKSPVAGQITKIQKRVGELVQPVSQDVVISLLPESPFEIEANIYEEDVVKINIGNPADISPVAFPEKIFKGKVVSIDPAQKLIEGVIYYKVTINFEEIPEGLKPGMTADLIIKTALKENVLMIPEDAVQKKDGKTTVQVVKDGEFEEREIEIGFQGSNNLVEVTSGLEEGEKVIIQ